MKIYKKTNINKLIKISISLLMSLLIFFGCSSSISTVLDSNSSTEDSNNSNGLLQISLSGVVIDGLIKGAKVCLDNNPMDGECNIEETIVSTDSDGKFDFGIGHIKNYGITLSYVAYGGIDTATGKPFESKLRFVTIVEDNTSVYITPLTDLIATDFFNQESNSNLELDRSQDKISIAFGIQKELLYKNPYEYGGVFIKSQEVQQIKSIFRVLINKKIETQTTFSEKLSIEDKIKLSMLNSISENNGYFKTQSTFENLEKNMQDLSFVNTNFTFMDNEKSFITEQLTKIRLDLDNFNNTFVSYNPRFEEYQEAIENKAEMAYEIINNAISSDTLVPFDLNIDIHSQNTYDNNNGVSDDNNQPNGETKAGISFSGVVVDGYIEDALVCIDEDLNGICTEYDYKTYTDKNGVYSFEGIELEKDSYIQIIATGGVDTFTNKSREGSLNKIISTNDLNEEDQVVVSPMSDLVSTDFLKNNTSLLDSQQSVSLKFNTTYEKLLSDPTDDKELFLNSLYIEQIKKSVENLFASKISDLVLLRTNIKKALLSGINQGYNNLLAEKVLNSIMTTYGIVVYTDAYYKVYEEIGVVINNLKNSPDIKVYTLANVQKIFENEISDVIYSNINSVNLDISIDTIIASDFDQTDAQYDIDACKESIYNNNLTDTNETNEIKIDKYGNGISVASKYDNVTLYYPNLGVEKSASTLSYTDNFTYQLQFDEAWIGEGKSAYIKTVSQHTNLSECYRIDFDSKDLTVTKVFSYSYN